MLLLASLFLIISNLVIFFDQHLLRRNINTFYLVAILLYILLFCRKLPVLHNRYFSVHDQTRNAFCGTWYLPHSHLHNERTVPIIMAGHIAHARNGRIFTSGLNVTSPLCFPTPIFFMTR